MNISLSPELEEYIHGKVKTNGYNTASEVVREALRLLQRQDEEHDARLSSLRADLGKAMEQFDRGEYVEAKDLTVERIRRGAIKRFGEPKKRKRA